VRSRFNPVAAIVVLVTFGSSGATFAQTPEACGGPKAKITKKVDKPLGEAQKASNEKNWEEVLVKVAEAEAVPVEKSEYDRYWINEFKGNARANMKNYAEGFTALEAGFKSPCMSEEDKPRRTKILMQLAYQAKNYPQSVEYGKLAVQLNPGDLETINYLGNAYFQIDDNQNARVTMADYIAKMEASGKVPEEQGYRILQTACLRLKDDNCVTEQIEKLVAHYPKPTYWTDLINSLLRVSKSDNELLNILRLADGAQVMNEPSHYTEMAQLAMAQGLPGEAQSIIEKGNQKKVFAGSQREGDHASRILADAKQAVTLDKSTLDKQDASARAKTTGDSDVKLGAAYLSYGMNDKAIEALQRGIGKGSVKNPDEAGLLLGIAYLRMNNKEEALKAFQTVKQNPTMVRIAKLWALNTEKGSGTG
jgi:tetratricopeptide (TPR) repeat protein